MFILLLWTFSILFIGISADPSVLEIETPKGRLLGKEFISRGGRPYIGFRGIPYGKISERFQIAEPFPSWKGTRNAQEFGNVCPQISFETKEFVGDEASCLVLNVYKPMIENAKDAKLPVMLWIHGGGLEWGSSNQYDAKYFMDESVLLVTINYRLGALGFLSTDDSEVQGNLGLKDQILSLLWVQENIEAFSGDKNKVTIFGESAGSISVHGHMVSTMSKGLFHNAISQSGVALTAEQKNPRSIANEFGTRLNCPITSSKVLVECLKSKSEQEIVNSQSQLKRWSFFPFSTFGPSIESNNDSKEPKFLIEEPETTIKSGKFNRVPWMVGFNRDEGDTMSTPLLMIDEFVKDMNQAWNRVIPIALNYDDLLEEKKNEISETIYKFYFDKQQIGEETRQNLSDLFTDAYFISGTDKSAKLHAKYAPVYTYVFTYAGGDATLLRGFGVTGDHGVGHFDELQYLFNGLYGTPEYLQDSKHELLDISQKFVSLWVSFATNSAPTAIWKDATEWKPISHNSTVKYFSINSKTSVWNTKLEDRIAFWKDVDKIIKSSDKRDEL